MMHARAWLKGAALTDSGWLDPGPRAHRQEYRRRAELRGGGYDLGGISTGEGGQGFGFRAEGFV